MYIESFRQIIEIESLKAENQKNTQNIESEKKRTLKLLEQKQKAKEDLERLTAELHELPLKNTLALIDKSKLALQKLQQQENLAKDQKEALAFAKQIEAKKIEVSDLEVLGLELLEREDFLECEIKRLKEFSTGLESSSQIIGAETDELIEKEKSIINARLQRVSALLDQCRLDFKNTYLALEKKFYPKSPVSFLIDRKCQSCFIQVDSILKSSLEEGRTIETCPHCSRLLIPETVKIF